MVRRTRRSNSEDELEKVLLKASKKLAKISLVILPFYVGASILLLPYYDWHRKEMPFREAWESFYQEEIKPDFTWERLKEQIRNAPAIVQHIGVLSCNYNFQKTDQDYK